MERAWDALVRAAVPAAEALGSDRLARAARALAPPLARCWPERRRALRAVARGWMGLDLDPAAERALLERAVAEECARQAELLGLGSLADELARCPLPVEGAEWLDRGRGRDRGVVLATCHGGPHHLAGLALAGRGLPMLELGLPPEAVDRVLDRPGGLASALRRHEARARQRLPVASAAIGPRAGVLGLRRALRALAEGAVLILPGDGLWGRDTLEVPLLAGRARLPTGPARLACLAGAALAWGAVLPGAGGWTLRIEPWAEPPAKRDAHGAAARAFTGEAVRGYAAWLAAQVRARPELHLWRWSVIHRLQERGLQDFFRPGGA